MSHDPSHGTVRWIKMDDLAAAIYAEAWRGPVHAVDWFLSGLEPENLPDYHTVHIAWACWFLRAELPSYEPFLVKARVSVGWPDLCVTPSPTGG